MAEGWVCPRCELVLAPHVAQHRCEPPAAGVTAVPAGGTPGPWPGTMTVVISPAVADGYVVTYETSAGPYEGNVAETPRHLRSVTAPAS
jgi:hypothetical protein